MANTHYLNHWSVEQFHGDQLGILSYEIQKNIILDKVHKNAGLHYFFFELRDTRFFFIYGFTPSAFCRKIAITVAL